MKNLSIKMLSVCLFSCLFSLQGWSQSKVDDQKMSLKHTGHMVNKSSSSGKRQPVRMTAEMAEHQLKNMRDHLKAITAIVGAMATKDFKNMEKEATRLASSAKMKMMCNHMGKATPGFTKMGLALHSTADSLVHAANKKDYSLFVQQLGATLRTCTSCHSTFKQEIVSQDIFHRSMMK